MEDSLVHQARVSLSNLQALANPLEIQLRTAAVIAKVLERLGDHVIVGGRFRGLLLHGRNLSFQGR